MTKPIELKLGDICILEGRFYVLEWSKYSNGKMQGNRALLRLLNKDELSALLLMNVEGVANG